MPCNNIFWEFHFICIPDFLWQNVLSLVDQRGSLFVDLSLDVFFDGCVRVWHLGDNEVQEDEGRENDHDHPGDPEQNVLFCVQLTLVLIIAIPTVDKSEHTEIEVSKRKSQGGQDISPEEANVTVLIGWVRGNDVEDHGEHDDQDEEEKHKDSQVNNNTNDHSDDVTEAFDDTHEEESFEKTDHSDDNHGDLGVQLPSA